MKVYPTVPLPATDATLKHVALAHVRRRTSVPLPSLIDAGRPAGGTASAVRRAVNRWPMPGAWRWRTRRLHLMRGCR